MHQPPHLHPQNGSSIVDLDSYYSKPGKCAPCCRFIRHTLSFLLSHIGLLSLVAGYCIMGAFIFEKLEHENEIMVKRNMTANRHLVTDHLWKITKNMEVLRQEDWTDEVSAELKNFERTLIIAMKEKGWDGKENEDAVTWNFTGGLFYSITVITTIGYGHIAPKTPIAKVVTIFYAILGIPLTVICWSNIGDAMANAFRFCYWRVCCYICYKKPKKRKRRSSSKSRGHLQQAPLSPALVPSTPVFTAAPLILQDPPLKSKGKMGAAEVMSKVVPKGLKRGSLKSDKSQSSSADWAKQQQPTPISGPAMAPPLTDATLAGQANLVRPNSIRLPTAAGSSQISTTPVTTSTTTSSLTTQTSPQQQGPPGLPPAPPPQSVLSYSSASGAGGTSRQGRAIGDDWIEDSYYGDGISDDESESYISKPVPIWLSILSVLIYIGCGAHLFREWEGWSWLDSSYFCFITLTTIGFGDLVPNQKEKDGETRIALCSLYLLFGIAMICMSFNLVQAQVINNVRTIGKQLGIVKSDSDDEDD